jgi:hypothetical protein
VLNLQHQTGCVLNPEDCCLRPEALGLLQVFQKRRGCATQDGTTPMLGRVNPIQLVAVYGTDSGYVGNVNNASAVAVYNHKAESSRAANA